MTEPTTPPPPEEPAADETVHLDPAKPAGHGAAGSAGATATSILESVRDAVDELASARLHRSASSPRALPS